MAITLGDVVNQHGDLYVSATVPPLAAGRIWVPLWQAVRASNYGWRWKAAEADPWGGMMIVEIERGGAVWKKRRG